MRLGIRAKLVGTLLLAGLLPLAFALGVILFGAVELRLNTKGQTFRALARQQAGRLSTILGSQVELARVINALPGTVDVLREANARPKPSPEEIQRIESEWLRLGPTDPPLRAILNNRLAQYWKSVRAGEGRFTEIIVTDVSGRLVAATNKTSDYFQGDEPWWSACFDEGRGRVLITGVILDESVTAPDGARGMLVADLCLPIYEADATATTRRLIGICKVSLDATWVLGHLDAVPRTEDFDVSAWLARGDGKSVPGARVAPPVPDVPPSLVKKFAESPDGWTKEDSLSGYEVIGFASVEQSRIMMPNTADRWYVVVAASKAQVVRSLYRMAWLILGLGLAIIAACFMGGWIIAHREIVRPLLALEHAAEQLRQGNRGYRLSEARGPSETFRTDELGHLAHGFNVMADQLEGNFHRLEQADEVKRQFIDLASHELRTPVTYILGAAHLAQKQAEGSRREQDRPAGVMSRISTKAQRLNRIVENMFKLLAGERSDRDAAMRPERVDLADSIRSAINEHEAFLKERSQSWNLQVDENLPPISADPDKLRDILANLISNAIRFSPDGGIVGVGARAAADGMMDITVSDTGPGIPPDDLPHLFQPFFTGAGTVERHTSGDYQYMSRGIGLGLSVVKRFVEMHGGDVSVDTSPTGTKVTVRLPTGERDPR